MSKSNQKVYVPDLFRGKELVLVTPSLGWTGAAKYVGSRQQAVLIGDSYYDSEGAKFVMGDGHWELVE